MIVYPSLTLLTTLLLIHHHASAANNKDGETTTMRTSVGMRMPLRAIDILNTHQYQHSLSTTLGDEEEDGTSTKSVQELFFSQTLNHFSFDDDDNEDNDDDGTTTFSQRYFYSDRFVQPQPKEEESMLLRGGKEEKEEQQRKVYAFLCAGGEGPALTKHVLTDSVHCTGDLLFLAQRLFEEENAIVHLFALEHRYYGQSYPEFPDNSSPVSNQNLQYLTSKQAIHDIANFISYANQNYLSSSSQATPKWVTFGGSYPGMISAWSRFKFPNSIHASVSNSSPVQAQLDFPEYNNHVAFDLGYEGIGGSDECLEIVVQGHAEIAQLLKEKKEEGGFETVAEMFNVCDGAKPFYEDEMNVKAFLGDGVIYVPAQGNDPGCSDEDDLTCNIAHVCKALTTEYSKSGSAMKSLASIAKKQQYGKCTKADWSGTLDYISSDAAQAGGLRSWLWQTCNEFGFYQTCNENSSCPYGRGYHTLDQDLEICRVAFGVDPKTAESNVQASLEYYGGWDMDGSRIIFVNGNVDPWAELSITGERGREGQPTVWVKEASHHFWTHMVKETDGEAVEDARLVIQGQIMEWLEEEDGKEMNTFGRFDELDESHLA